MVGCCLICELLVFYCFRVLEWFWWIVVCLVCLVCLVCGLGLLSCWFALAVGVLDFAAVGCLPGFPCLLSFLWVGII